MENVTNLPEEGANVTNENVTETASVNTETVTTANDAVESLENANTAMATAETNVAEMPNPEVAIEATPAEIQQTEDAIEAPAEIVDAAPKAIETVASEAEAKPKSVEAKETPAKAETPDAPVDHETAALDAAHSELAGGEHEHEDEVQEPVEDYHTYKKEQLVEAIEKTVNEGDVIAVRNKVFAMREAFSQMQSAERNTALNSFIEEGGNKDDFHFDEDESTKRFYAAFELYKKKRTDHSESIEKQKVDNLHAKQAILQNLKDLLQNEDNMAKAYDGFNEMQAKWRNIGPVPSANYRDLQMTYKLYIDRFYEFVKINKDLQQLDQKKNLILKVNLCEKAEELMLEPSINKATAKIREYIDQWKDIGQVSRDIKNEIWDRFKAAIDKVYERRREYETGMKSTYEENLIAKQALCEKAEAITQTIHDKHNAWQDNTQQVLELQTAWKGIGAASRKDNDDIWARFKSACDNFFKNKNDFYTERKKELAGNLQLKTELCIQAEGLKDSNDWRATTQNLVRLQEEWKKIGPVPEKSSNKVWARFKAACDEFFNSKKNHFSNIDNEQDDNYAKKIALIEEIEKYEMAGDNVENLDNMKRFQRQWMEIGLVPFNKKDEVQKRYKTALDKLYDNLRLDEREKNSMRSNQRYDAAGSAGYNSRDNNRNNNMGTNRVVADKGGVNARIAALNSDVTIWQNNIGFFAKSKNAESIRKEFDDKINKAKEEIAKLRAQLNDAIPKPAAPVVPAKTEEAEKPSEVEKGE
nr:DUF349 domain-containing protein [Bacteroidota bacterium]